MAKYVHQINAFNAGEFSPLMEGRTDFEKRRGAAAEITNFFPTKQGPLTFRPGSKYLTSIKDTSARTELMKFNYSATDNFLIECGANYFRFFKDRALITRSKTITGVTQANPGVATIGGSATTITAITNTTPMVCKTGSAHGLSTRMVVDIESATASGVGNAAFASAINQSHYIKVLSTTTFALYDDIDFKTANGVSNSATYDASSGNYLEVFDTGTMVKFTVSAGMTQLDGDYVQVSRIADTRTFQLLDLTGANIDTSAYTAWSGSQSASYQGIVHPYSQSDLFDSDGLFRLSSASSGDFTFLAHEDYYPRELIRYADNVWAIQKIGYNKIRKGTGTITDLGTTYYVEAGPWGEKQDGDVSNEGGTTGIFGTSTPAVGSTANASVDRATFNSTDVGRLMRYGNSVGWGYGVITAVVDSDTVTVRCIEKPSGTVGKLYWYLGAWSDTTGYPSCVALHQGRLWFGMGRTLYASAVDAFYDFAPNTFDYTTGIDMYTYDVADDRAINVSLNANGIDQILWMESMEHGLVVGTNGGEFVITPSDEGGAITPTDINSIRPTAVGSRLKQALNVYGNVLFPQSSLRRMREFRHSDGYQCNDMNILSDHMTVGGIERIAFQKEPYSLVWCLLNDGTLLALTYDRDQEIAGWSGHAIAGSDVIVESIQCIPTPDGQRDELWMIVNRNINGVGTRYIEYLAQDWLFDTTAAESSFVGLDCSVTQSGTSTTITGLSHLNGEDVAVVVDGATHPVKRVSGGQITLDYAPVATTHVGYSYTGVWESLDLTADPQRDLSATLPLIKRINKVDLMLYQTSGLWVGPSSTEMDEIEFRTTDMDMQAAIPLYDGLKQVTFRGNNQRRTRVRIEQRNPFPCTIVGIYPHLETNTGV